MDFNRGPRIEEIFGICQCCKSVKMLFNIADVDNGITYLEAIRDLCSLQILPNYYADGITRFICYVCIKRLRQCYEFRRMIEYTQMTLCQPYVKEYLSRLDIPYPPLFGVNIVMNESVNESLDLGNQVPEEERVQEEDLDVQVIDPDLEEEAAAGPSGISPIDLTEDEEENAENENENENDANDESDDTEEEPIAMVGPPIRLPCFCSNRYNHNENPADPNVEYLYESNNLNAAKGNKQLKVKKEQVLPKFEILSGDTTENDNASDFCFEISSQVSQVNIETEGTNTFTITEDSYGDRSHDSIGCSLPSASNSSMSDIVRFAFRPPSVYSCNICGAMFENDEKLTEHQRTHTGKMICDLCKKEFMHKSAIREHLKWHLFSSSKQQHRISCPICAREMSRKYFMRHMNHHDSNGDFKFGCPFCSERFPNYRMRTEHMYKKHNISHPKFKCKVCGSKFVSEALYQNHLTVEHNKRSEHVCQVCDYQAYSAAGLHRHMAVHSTKYIEE